LLYLSLDRNAKRVQLHTLFAQIKRISEDYTEGRDTFSAYDRLGVLHYTPKPMHKIIDKIKQKLRG